MLQKHPLLFVILMNRKDFVEAGLGVPKWGVVSKTLYLEIILDLIILLYKTE